MGQEQRFIVDVGLTNLPFPTKVASRQDPNGQCTVADISISARISQLFEAYWINKFIEVLHSHREMLRPDTLQHNILDYISELKASSASATYTYPIFIEKETPVSKEKCLVRYRCSFTARASSVEPTPTVSFSIEVPVLTTYPVAEDAKASALFAQLTMVTVEIQPRGDFYPEDLAQLVEREALAPVYSYLKPEDEAYIIERAHSTRVTSVVMADAVKAAFARDPGFSWASVRCQNYGMLHPYSTVVRTEKSVWVPFSNVGE